MFYNKYKFVIYDPYGNEIETDADECSSKDEAQAMGEEFLTQFKVEVIEVERDSNDEAESRMADEVYNEENGK